MSRFEDFSFEELMCITNSLVVGIGFIRDHALELPQHEALVDDLMSLFREAAEVEKQILIDERKHSGLEPMLGGSNGKEQQD